GNRAAPGAIVARGGGARPGVGRPGRRRGDPEPGGRHLLRAGRGGRPRLGADGRAPHGGRASRRRDGRVRGRRPHRRARPAGAASRHGGARPGGSPRL
ncbi:MAG: hypothetical protein AVDCRST_MAG89-2542, partial [uncultured Gemmatimonadetes bacterium]